MPRQTEGAPGPRLAYQPELDAIRGVAVLLVLAQHFGFFGTGLEHGRAGQVGVTLFFALSGFLITRLLMAERDSTGRVALGRFYVRRARRLAPALVYMVAVVWLAGLPGDARAPLTYVSNWYLHLGVGELGAYVHTWTLAIEEQFYLIWPVLFLLLARWPRAMMAIVSVVAAVSAATFESPGVIQRNAPLLGGAMVALSGARFPRWAGSAGWAVVAATAFVPGRVDAVLLAVASVASVCVVGAPGPIAWQPLVWLGTISYGVYLWSYPIAYLVPTSTIYIGPTLFGIAMTFVMAILSDRFVERRWRLRRLTGNGRARPRSVVSALQQPRERLRDRRHIVKSGNAIPASASTSSTLEG